MYSILLSLLYFIWYILRNLLLWVSTMLLFSQYLDLKWCLLWYDMSQQFWHCFNTFGPRQNGLHFADDMFKYISLNKNARISIKISPKFVPKDPINNILALIQIMAWHRPGDRLLSEPMMVSLLTHICVNPPQWVNYIVPGVVYGVSKVLALF